MKLKNSKQNNDKSPAPARVKTRPGPEAAMSRAPAFDYRIQSILVPIDFSEASN